MRTALLGCLAALVIAGEAPPAAASATAPAAARPVVAPDPSAAVIAEGAFTYRQRDLDALLLVALRHARTKELAADGKPPLITKSDEDRVRQVMIRALVAREALVAAIAALPEQIPPAARDAIVLDLLAYQADPAANPAPAAPATPAATTGPVIVRLPPFTITRAIEGQGRRQLTLGLALAFTDPAQAKALEAQAPLMQDAMLAALRGLAPATFLDPDHAALKLRLTDAIRAKIPSFPADGLLIPQLETGAADAAATDR